MVTVPQEEEGEGEGEGEEPEKESFADIAIDDGDDGHDGDDETMNYDPIPEENGGGDGGGQAVVVGDIVASSKEGEEEGEATCHPSGGDGDGDEPPTGKFRTKLCESCWTFDGLCLSSWFCVPVLLAQIMQRLKLNFLAFNSSNDDNQYRSTCQILTVTYAIVVFATVGIGSISSGGISVYYVWHIFIVALLTMTRLYVRNRYNIPGQTFGDTALDDCCYSYWCTCCTLVQLHRHTHDETKYRYKFSSNTGLPDDAPELLLV